jgi:hypothetical protein
MRRCFIAGLLLATLGCGSNEPNVAAIIRSNNDCNGKRLVNLYYMHQSMSPRLNGPKNEGAFQTFIKSMRPEQLEEMGVESSQLDKLFVSERDGQPFTVRYGVDMPGSGSGHHQAVVFEQRGKSGRIAVFLTGPKVIYAPSEEASAYREGLHDELSVPPEQKGE